jgi:predicted pyridoxine 5'-phosphate oxidase superfamily flavin-nucleotide-binding protein
MGVLTNEMQAAVRAERLGYVATVNADETPNVAPKGTTTVLDADHLVFADIASPRTVANLRVRQPLRSMWSTPSGAKAGALPGRVGL